MYSHTKNNRLWIKIRNLVNGTCIGTEINRNFDFQWMVSGFDINPCSGRFLFYY